METNNHVDKNKQQIESQIEQYKQQITELLPEKEELGKKYAKLERECKSLEKEVQKLETGHHGDEQAYEEYLKQLETLDNFRWLRKKGSTQLTNRFAQVNIWGNNYLADRSLPRVFLRTFLTYLTNFDAPNVAQITQAFAGRTGANALVANTGTANNPTEKSAQWIVQEWAKFNNHAKHMIAVGPRADILKEAEVVMPGVLPVRNVANYISKHANNRTNINAMIDGSESFIPYWQQVHVQNSGYTHYDIKEYDLLKFCEFLFPADLTVHNNALINLQTGQTADSANDYRLSSGTNDHTLLDKDYKNTVLFPLYETSTSAVNSISTTHELEDKGINLEWKFQEGSTDKWISKRYAHEFRNASTNNLNNFAGVVSLFHEVFKPAQTQLRQWIMDTSGWNSATNTYDNQADKLSALQALFQAGYNLSKDKLISGSEIIPGGEPNSEEYLKKQEKLSEKRISRDEVKKEYDLVLGKSQILAEEVRKLEKQIGKYTKSDKNSLHARLKNVHQRIEAKYDSATKKWTTKTNQKFNWEYWSNLATDYDEYLELLGTDESQWEAKEKELINTKLKPGTHKYFKDVIQVNYNNLTANFHKYITGKTPQNKTNEQFLTEWIKDKNNAKAAEKIVRDLEALKSFINLDSDYFGEALKKISESDLIRTDLESALKRVLDTDYNSTIKSKWAKTDYATGSKFWDLVKPFYLNTESSWKNHVKEQHGVHDNLKDWLKDADLEVEQFIACIHLYRIKGYTNGTADQRKEQRAKEGQELLNCFAEVDKLGYSYHDIVNDKNADFTAVKAYEELKNKILGSLDEALGLDKKTDSETINKWANFKEYSTSERIETLLKDLWEEIPAAEKDGKPTKKVKEQFLQFVGSKDFKEFLKEKSPAEVVATVRRFELKDITEEEIKTKEPKGQGKEFEANKAKITQELESIKAKYEEIKEVGQTLTAEEEKVYTLVTAQLAHLSKLETKTAPAPIDEDMTPKVKAQEDDDKSKTQVPEKGHLAKHWWKYALGLVGIVGIGVAAWYFLKGNKGQENEENSESENPEEN